MTYIEQENILLTPDTQPRYLADGKAYRRWRDDKLAAYPVTADRLRLTVRDPACLSTAEIEQINRICNAYGFVLFDNAAKNMDKALLKSMGRQLGLEQLDRNLCADEEGVSSISVHQHSALHETYIPYSTRGLSWHTDGYYNKSTEAIRGVILYCKTPAAAGGGNQFMDHEVLYILLREQNPAFITALSAADVMTIPPNIVDGREIRGRQTGPVFSLNPLNGRLHMRYSARKRHIVWKQDAMTRAAVAAIEKILNSQSRYIVEYTPQAETGVISSNCLHNRSSYSNDASRGLERLIYRARYHDVLAGSRNLPESTVA